VGLILSEQVQQVLEYLPPATRAGVEQRLDYLAGMPRMYAVGSDDRFPGCRTFWVDPCYRVFYMVAAEADDVYVAAVIEEDVSDGFAALPPPAFSE
jgi:hypothetical protein